MAIANDEIPKIIVVGGGAGGLELVTKLGRKLGKKGKANITLVDNTQTHIWKPLLHEVAAGTLDSHQDEIEYLGQAMNSGFRFCRGRMDSLDRESKTITLAATCNADGIEIIPRRNFDYDTLIIAVGSVSHDFGIVGAGATGVELSAKLHEVSHLLNAYGLDEVQPADVNISIIEAADRVLPGLPERLSAATEVDLNKLGVNLLTNERVVEITADDIKTESGKVISAAIKVWAAGIKAPVFLSDLGLETNAINQTR